VETIVKLLEDDSLKFITTREKFFLFCFALSGAEATTRLGAASFSPGPLSTTLSANHAERDQRADQRVALGPRASANIWPSPEVPHNLSYNRS